MEKYPVTTEFGVYKVKIDSKYVALGEYQLVVKVYKDVTTKRKTKQKLAYKRETGWGKYDKYMKDLKGLAIETVKDYEESIRKEIEDELAYEQSIKEFEEWDGRC